MKCLVPACTVAFLLVLGCHRSPPPEAPPPPPPVAEEKPPPPSPKCERLDEGCVAKAGSKARLDPSGWSLEPPAEWQYAQGSLIVAMAHDSILAVTLQEHEPKKNEKISREAAFAVLVREMNLEFPKKKLNWPKKPDHIVEAGEFKVSLYQFESMIHAGKKGTLLVFSILPKEMEGLLGAGFVPDDDSSNADQSILAAIRSIAKTAAAGTASGGDAAQ
jgi:hypothetical protein